MIKGDFSFVSSLTDDASEMGGLSMQASTSPIGNKLDSLSSSERI